MATPSSNEISFNTFYLTEFFNISIAKARNKIADSHLRLLKGLGAYLLKEDKIVDGLEQVARYQNSNDLAIFLFDMIERANDYGPKIVYNSLDDLAEDFVNLYTLMMEDEESVDTFKQIVEKFQKKYGDLEKEKHLEDFLEMAQASNLSRESTPELSVNAYFKKALKSRFDGDANDFIDILFSAIDGGMTENEAQTAMQPVFARLCKVYPGNIDSHVVSEDGLNDLAGFLKKEIKNIRQNDPGLILKIIQNHSLDVLPDVDDVKISEPKPVSSLDALLVDYFRSEVEDWGKEISDMLNEPLEKISTPSGLKQIVASTKALKELSMIHGYSGLEHIAHILTKEFEKLQSSSFAFTAESVSLLQTIISELKQVELFAEKSKSGQAVSNIREQIDQLRQTYAEPYVVEEVDDTPVSADEEAEELVEVTEISDGGVPDTENPDPEADWFGYDDPRYKQAFADVMQVVAKKAKQAIKESSNEMSMAPLFRFLSENGWVFPANFEAKIMNPFIHKYQSLQDGDVDDLDKTKSVLSTVWDELAGSAPSEIDVDALAARLEKINTGGIAFSDPQVAEALAQVIDRRRELLGEAFLQGFDSDYSPESVDAFLQFMDDRLKLVGAESYRKFVIYFQQQIRESRQNLFSGEIIDEFLSAFNLFVERLGRHGFSGDCDDIIDALSDIVQQAGDVQQESVEAETSETEKVPEPSVTQKASDESRENEDLVLFREEASDNIRMINEGLAAFKDSNERSQLNKVENAAHSIRSAAHLLHFENAAKLAYSIEEISEVFGQSDMALPENLCPYLENAAKQLEKLLDDPDIDSSEVIARLDSLLDQVVIQDSGTPDTPIENTVGENIPSLQTPSDLADEPLFASDSGEDEELRTIFKEESATFLTDISAANEVLKKQPDDEAALKKLGYAAHSLKSAAKMLGFIETSQITDNLERIIEGITDGKLYFDDDLYEKISEALDVLKRISDGENIESTLIARLIDSLDVSHWEHMEPVESVTDDKEVLPDNMLEVFVDEARDLIAGLNDDFLELENLPESEMILANALRRLHTLKGSAYISKFNHIGDLAHKMEDFFQLYKTSNGNTKAEMLNSAFMAIDLISDMVSHAALSGSDEIDQLTPRLAAIDNKLFSFQNLVSPEAGTSGIITSVTQEKKVKTGISSSKSGDKNILKIDTEYMDKMVDMASELMINQTQLGANLHALKEILANIEGEKKQIRAAENIIEDTILQDSDAADSDDDPGRKYEARKVSENIKDVVRAVNLISKDLNRLTENFDQNIGRLNNISKLLHSDILKTRMVPVDNLFNRYPRAVRDMAKKQHKKVNLIIEDNNTEMDRAMVEGLAEPILHIIRNAIDHGIETVEERKAKGKPENGTLVLRARQERSQILIDIEDDGRGIDIERVKEQILKRKLVDKPRLERLSDAEILDFIFYPEFTTREEATTESGRGIGLDAVATQLQKLKGNVRLKTEQGVGTSFILRVPLTLVVSHALMVKVANQTIAMPVLAVQETIQFHNDEIIEDDGKKYIRVRGRLLPFVPLEDILQFSGPELETDEVDERLAVVIFDAGISVALGIQDIVGRQEIVIKSLGSHLQNVEYIAGGTIMADGEVALILDFARVIKKVENQYFGTVNEKSPVKKFDRKIKSKKTVVTEKFTAEPEQTDEKIKVKVVKNRAPKIMIVDDSNSVRNFVGSILERNNFVTVKAVNGADALDKLKAEKVDLIITDLEMPKMHGFDLISNIREQSKYAHMPIIILTGRAGMKHRQTGEELGANAFIVKPFKENDLLASIGEFIKAG